MLAVVDTYDTDPEHLRRSRRQRSRRTLLPITFPEHLRAAPPAILRSGGAIPPQTRVGTGGHPSRPPTANTPACRFLMIWFTCCGTYGRATRNLEGSHYVGYCPRCNLRVQAQIGPQGTRRRMFRTNG